MIYRENPRSGNGRNIYGTSVGRYSVLRSPARPPCLGSLNALGGEYPTRLSKNLKLPFGF